MEKEGKAVDMRFISLGRRQFLTLSTVGGLYLLVGKNNITFAQERKETKMP